MKFFIALAVTGILAAAVPAAAEQSIYVKTVQELVLNDGSRLYGSVEAETDAEIVFKTTGGVVVRAPRGRVVSMRPVNGRMLGGEFRREDPNDTRLLFGPTGRSIPRGQTYLGVYEAMMPFVQVGVTDQFSIGGGTPLIFDIDGGDRPYWFTPKLQVFSDGRTHAAVGVFHGAIGDDNAGIAYGVVTRETRGGAFTVGAGMGYTSEGGRGGVVMVGGDAPVRRSIKVVSENYLWRSAAITSGGFRFFGEHLSADLAIAVAISDEGTFGFPVVNFVYRF